MKNFKDLFLGAVITGILGILIVGAAPIRATINTWYFGIQKADDATRYSTIKQVEDTCRAMIASYNADWITWQQYRADENTERRGWGDQAKMRANKTASTYNNYVLQNNFVWQGNVPADIRGELAYIQ